MSRRGAATAFTLKPAILEDLLANEAVDSVLLQGVEGGFHILIGFGAEEKPLGLARGDRERVFKTLESADRYLTELGIEHFAVDKTRYFPAPHKEDV